MVSQKAQVGCVSTIFKNLPEMMLQQVLEFAGGDGKLYILNYDPKKKAIVIMLNPAFMRDTLMYKINNPCKPEVFRNIFGTVYRETYTYVPPSKTNKPQPYSMIVDNYMGTCHLEFSPKHKGLITSWNNKINRKKKLESREKEINYINSVSIRNIYPDSTFKESILKMCVRKVVLLK